MGTWTYWHIWKTSGSNANSRSCQGYNPKINFPTATVTSNDHQRLFSQNLHSKRRLVRVSSMSFPCKVQCSHRKWYNSLWNFATRAFESIMEQKLHLHLEDETCVAYLKINSRLSNGMVKTATPGRFSGYRSWNLSALLEGSLQLN